MEFAFRIATMEDIPTLQKLIPLDNHVKKEST
jgi:hypothetical protein